MGDIEVCLSEILQAPADFETCLELAVRTKGNTHVVDVNSSAVSAPAFRDV
jgi:hypothetical protein